MNSIAMPETTLRIAVVEECLVFSPTLPIWSKVIGWVLLIPLVFYSVNGWILTGSTPARLGFGATQEATPVHRLILLSIAAIVFTLSISQFRSICETAARNVCVFILPAMAIASCFWSGVPKSTLINSFFLVVETLLALFLSVRFTRNQQLEILVFTATAAFCVSWISVIFFPSVGVDHGAWRGIFSHHNNCGAIAVFFCICAYYYQGKTLVGRLSRRFVLLSGIIFIVMAASRTGWEMAILALAFGCLASVLSRFSPRDRFVLMFPLLVLTVVSGALIYNYWGELLTLIGKDATLDQRTVIWDATLQAALQQPWTGYGYTAFWRGLTGPSEMVVLREGWVSAQAQCGYIDLLLNLGATGLAAFVILLVAIIQSAVKAERSVATLSLDFRWCAITVAIFLIYNIGESSIISAYDLTWLLFVLGAFGLRRCADGEMDPDIDQIFSEKSDL
jgi:exopolysaccharide production protein ExoQ